jgi:hypothetical protein
MKRLFNTLVISAAATVLATAYPGGSRSSEGSHL